MKLKIAQIPRETLNSHAYLRISYGCHIIIQLIWVLRKGRNRVYICICLWIPPLHQARDTEVQILLEHGEQLSLGNTQENDILEWSLCGADDGRDSLSINIVVSEVFWVRFGPGLWQQQSQPVTHICGCFCLVRGEGRERERIGIQYNARVLQHSEFKATWVYFACHSSLWINEMIATALPVFLILIPSKKCWLCELTHQTRRGSQLKQRKMFLLRHIWCGSSCESFWTHSMSANTPIRSHNTAHKLVDRLDQNGYNS